MWIERLQVEPEGFLRDLDVEFVPGLNVIIGARGTGKTSIVELLRWCLGAPGFTRDAASKGEQQSLAILSGAAATVTAHDGGERYVYTRAEESAAGMPRDSRATVTVLAQNEMEAIGAQSSGRLFLLDRFRTEHGQAKRHERALQSSLTSLTAELRAIQDEGFELAQQVQQLGDVPRRLAETRSQQSALLSQASASAQDQEQLYSLDSSAKELASQESVVRESITQTRQLFAQADELLESTKRFAETNWARNALGAPAASAHLEQALDSLRTAAVNLGALSHTLDNQFSDIVLSRESIEDASRALRQKLDSMQSSLGAITRTVHELQEQSGQLEALQERLEDRRRHYEELHDSRIRVYREFSDRREAVSADREAVAKKLTSQLGPQVRIRVMPESRLEEYEGALIAAFRGSGIHYNSIVAQRSTVDCAPLRSGTKVFSALEKSRLDRKAGLQIVLGGLKWNSA